MCDAGSAWNQAYMGTTGQSYPYSFNVFAFGNISGIQDAQGPIAAGGSVNLSSFSVNGMGQQAVGLVSDGSLTLSNGKVGGAIFYGSAKNVDGTVTYDKDNISQQKPINFVTARATLQGMSQALRGYPANGTKNTHNRNLALTSSSPDLNVFSISSDDLSQAYSVTLTVPSGSTVLINVGGKNVQIANAGFNVSGQDLHKILWNFYEAVSVKMTSITFPGSVLAPYAQVNLSWGNMNGTLVADTVVSTAEFHQFQFQFGKLGL